MPRTLSIQLAIAARTQTRALHKSLESEKWYWTMCATRNGDGSNSDKTQGIEFVEDTFFLFFSELPILPRPLHHPVVRREAAAVAATQLLCFQLVNLVHMKGIGCTSINKNITPSNPTPHYFQSVGIEIQYRVICTYNPNTKRNGYLRQSLHNILLALQ